MSAATVFPEVKNATLQNLAFAILTSIRRANGTAAAGFTDRLGNSITLQSAESGGVSNTASVAGPGREVILEIRINPDGNSAYAKVKPLNPVGVQSVEGFLDPSLLSGTTL